MQNTNLMPKTKPSKETRPLNVLSTILLVILIFYVCSLAFLLLWGILTSFKAQSDFRTNIIGFPRQWVWNYNTVLENFYLRIRTSEGIKQVGMPQMYLNAFLYAAGCSIANCFTATITAYLCARYPYKFSKIMHGVVVVTMILPIVGSQVSEIQVARTLGLYDQIWGLWLMRANFLGMDFLIFYGTFKSMPGGYAEAAKIDGAGNYTVLFKIMLPLVGDLLMTHLVIDFIAWWNDYSTPIMYLPTQPTIAYGVYIMSTTTVNKLSTIPMRMTTAVLALVPVIVVFLIFQKRLLNNLQVGGLKG